MIHKDIRYRRHQRQRVIRKRILKIKNGWHEDLSTFSGSFSKPGRYAKWNMSCNCWMCRSKTRELGNKRSELRKLEREKDINGTE